jgi:anhydro-N-acetylmuramic acid kinase
MSKYISLGTMSGTSMDGIDLSIINSDGETNTSVIDNFFSNTVLILKKN